MKLTQEEKKYLFSKFEYKKKKKAIESKNEIYELLHGDKEDFTIDEVQKIIRSLEFTFRKRLIGDKPDLKNDLFLSIKGKLPENIVTVKQSRINYKPSKSASVGEIKKYLDSKKIKYDDKDTKSKLLSLLEGKVHIKRFNEI